MTVYVDMRNAPRIWTTVGSGMRVRTIDPAWLEQNRAPVAEVAKLAPPEPLSEIPFAEVSWAERASAYRRAVMLMSVPACHRPQMATSIILAQVADTHGVKVSEIKGPRRNRRVVAARHEAMWRIRTETNRSLPQIGHLLGGRDHTTVLHGLRQHEKRIAEQASCSR